MVDAARFYSENELKWRPQPKPWVKYDPKEEAPKWNWTRVVYNLPVDKGPIPWAPVGNKPEHPDQPDWRGVIRKNVIEYEIPEPYSLGLPNDPKYFWFDTPDYADPFKKLWYATKFFMKAGLVLASIQGTLEGKPMSVAQNISLARRVFVPWVVGGVTGAATVITLANLRNKKDDYYNYLAAGFVMSLVMWRKEYASWVRWVVVLPPAAVGIKYNAETNGQLMPKLDPRHYRGSIGGLDAKHGVGSGNFIPSWYPDSTWGDPGRDQRRVA